MKFTLSNHIIGKTYDLTQENLNRAIETAVSWHEEARRVLKDKKELAERVSNLQTEAAMWQEATTKSVIELAELLTYSVGIKEANSRLRSALKCANELISEFNSYSTGCSCLAEEDVAELFGKYTEALEAAEARQETLGALPGESANGAPSTASNPGGMVKGPAARGSSNLAAPPLQSEHVSKVSDWCRCPQCALERTSRAATEPDSSGGEK